MTNYRGGADFEREVRAAHRSPRAAAGFRPRPRGRARLCACGCGVLTSTWRTRFIKGHAPPLPHKVRIWRLAVINLSTGCWNWSGALYPNGYAGLTIAGRRALAHRISFQAFVGPIPDGLVLDHMCRNRACVNPDHLEPVTNGENIRRGVLARKREVAADA